MGLAEEGARTSEGEKVEERSLFESGLRSSAVEDADVGGAERTSLFSCEALRNGGV